MPAICPHHFLKATGAPDLYTGMYKTSLKRKKSQKQ